MRSRVTQAVVLACLFGGSTCFRADLASAEDNHETIRKADVREVRSDDKDAVLDDLIEALQSPKFADRSQAMLKLYRLGTPAIKKIEEASSSFDTETSRRAVEILRLHLHGADATRRHQSQQSLHRIAASPNHRMSRSAARILKPTTEMEFKHDGGVRTLSVDVDEQNFRFREDRMGITVDRPDGQGGIKKSVYKDATELANNDQIAHWLYTRFFKKFNGMHIRIDGQDVPDVIR